jgi:putative cardiolipin synthase
LVSSDGAQPYLRRLQEEKSTESLLDGKQSTHWISSARIVSDPAEKAISAARENWLLNTIFPVVNSATAELHLISPYFIPGPNGTSMLAGLVRDGVDVAVLTNSLAATDVAAVHGAYAKYRVDLLKGGVKLYELQPFDRQPKISVFGSKGASLHTKAFTVDDETAFVGSFNFDPRSVSVNTEMGVLVHDRHVAAELRRWIEREKSPEASYRLSLRGSKLGWEGDEDGSMRQYAWEPESTWSRRLLARLVRLLPIESQL